MASDELNLEVRLYQPNQLNESWSDEWLDDYNNERPHETLKNMTPRQYAEALQNGNSNC